MKYEKIGQRVGRTVDIKNQAYGNSFHNAQKILDVLYPNGVQPEQYKDMLGVIRIIDKLFRIATNNKDPLEENPWEDIAGYGVLKSEPCHNDIIGVMDCDEPDCEICDRTIYDEHGNKGMSTGAPDHKFENQTKEKE